MAEFQTPEFHPAFEEYCEAIYELREDDVDVIQARIAERLEISRPAVSEMIRRLEGADLVSIDGTIRLTEAGNKLAEQVVRRHRLAERFLTDILGLSWSEAHGEAAVMTPERPGTSEEVSRNSRMPGANSSSSGMRLTVKPRPTGNESSATVSGAW